MHGVITRPIIIAIGISLLGLVVAAFTTFQWPTREEEGGFCRCVYRDADGNVFPYQLFIPHGYRTGRTWPLILFLHGVGGSGDDGEKPLRSSGLGPAIQHREESFPFL